MKKEMLNLIAIGHNNSLLNMKKEISSDIELAWSGI
jgi:hypothetical protein